MTVSGFDQPSLHLGDTVIRLGAGGASVGNALYANLVGEVIDALVYSRTDEAHSYGMAYASARGTPRAVRTGLPPGEVVVALQREGKDRFKVDYGPVGVGGMAHFRLGSGPLRFVASAHELGLPAAGTPAATLLVRISNVPLNDLGSGILPPAQLSLTR